MGDATHTHRMKGQRLTLDRVCVGLAMLGVVAFFTWTVALSDGFAGGVDPYQLLARGYLKGQLHLDVETHPAMLALADPYDPALNGPYRVPDASYFHGKYYLYFGSGPVLLLMVPWYWLTGTVMPTGAAVLTFTTVGYLALCASWLWARRRFLPGSGVLVGVVGVVMLGFATHLLSLLRRPEMWEVALAGGFAFSALAFACSVRALGSARARWWIGAVGLMLGVGATCRPTVVLGAVMVAPIVWSLWAQRRRAEAWQGVALAALAGGLCVAAMLWHNYARFGDALQFGQTYQLSGAKEGEMTHWALRYALHNIYVYYLMWPSWTVGFPFVSAKWASSTIPGYFGGEEICGVLVTLPFLWFALVAPWRRAWRGGDDLETVGAVALAWYAPSAVLLLMFFSATERYMVDFLPAFGVMAVLGLLVAERWWQNALGIVGRAIVKSGVAALGLVTLVAAILISFDYHSRMLSVRNPVAWTAVKSRVEGWRSDVGEIIDGRRGPLDVAVTLRPAPVGTRVQLLRSRDRIYDESVWMEWCGADTIALGVGWRDEPVRWSAPVRFVAGQTHRLTVQLPGLDRDAGWALNPALASKLRMLVGLRWDGEKVYGALVPSRPYPADNGWDVVSHASVTAEVKARRWLPAQHIPWVSTADWIVSGPTPPRGSKVSVLAASVADGATAIWLETTEAGLRVRVTARGQVVAESATFPATAGGRSVVEVEHPPRWPFATDRDDMIPLACWVDGVLRWEGRIPWSAARPEELKIGGGAGWAVAGAMRRDGGALRFRVFLPEGASATAWPLLTWGAPLDCTYFGWHAEGPDRVRLFLDNYGQPLVSSGVVPRRREPMQEVTLSLASFAPSEFGATRRGRVTIDLNGQRVFDGEGEGRGFGPNGLRFGLNELGGTTCAEAFPGWILDARWTGLP